MRGWGRYRGRRAGRRLEEVLTDFWFNHLNVNEGKSQQEQVALARYENDAIRPHVTGSLTCHSRETRSARRHPRTI
jgi:uncharacterized protein (DUF1800 family)